MSTIELLAFDYVNFAENNKAYNIPIIYILAIAIGLIKKVEFNIQRGAYFLNIAFIFFGVSIAGGIWLLLIEAMINGYTFILVFVDILIWGFATYGFIIIAKARSNDAYGHSRYAWLAFVPFLCFWLLFKPSKNKDAPSTLSLISGVPAVFIGILIFGVVSGFSFSVEQSNINKVENVSLEVSEKIKHKYFEYYTKRDGLKAGLDYYKSLGSIGRIDEITYLNDIHTTDDTITYKFLITDNQITSFTQQERDNLEGYLCELGQIIIEHGGTMVLHYFNEANPKIAYIVGNDEMCSL